MSKENGNTQELILHAAEEEFLEKGYSGAKTVAIAERAGVTHAMLHYYFRTKEKLFNEIFEKKLRLMAQSLVEAFSRTDLPFVQRITEGISLHFDFLAANPRLPGFILHELSANSAQLEPVRTVLWDMAAELIPRMQEEMDELAWNMEITPMKYTDLMLSIASLNIFIFLSAPITDKLLCPTPEARAAFLEKRKKENIELILRRLKP